MLFGNVGGVVFGGILRCKTVEIELNSFKTVCKLMYYVNFGNGSIIYLH